MTHDTAGSRRRVFVAATAGGLGTTTLAVSLALRAASRGERVVLIGRPDAGIALELVAATEHLPGLRWPDLAQAEGPVDGDLLRARLPAPTSGVVVLAGGRPGAASETGVAPAAMDDVLAGLSDSATLTVIDVGVQGLDAALRRPRFRDHLVLLAGTSLTGMVPVYGQCARWRGVHDISRVSLIVSEVGRPRPITGRGSRADADRLAAALTRECDLDWAARLAVDPVVLRRLWTGLTPSRTSSPGRLADRLLTERVGAESVAAGRLGMEHLDAMGAIEGLAS